MCRSISCLQYVRVCHRKNLLAALSQLEIRSTYICKSIIVTNYHQHHHQHHHCHRQHRCHYHIYFLAENLKSLVRQIKQIQKSAENLESHYSWFPISWKEIFSQLEDTTSKNFGKNPFPSTFQIHCPQRSQAIACCIFTL